MRIKNSRKGLIVLAALGLTATPLGALAMPIQGAIGFGGAFQATGGTNLGDATGIDFLTAFVLAGNGDYSGVPFFTSASFTDFQFSPILTPSPVAPLWSVSSGGIDYSFDLADISVDFQSSTELNLSGSGTLMATGFDATPGTWVFSGDQAGSIIFTFSTITTAEPVAEPGILMLLGFGVLGLAAARRRL